MLVRALVGWFCILGVAIINGGLRDALVRPRFGEPVTEIFGASVLSGAAILAGFVVMRPAAAMHDWVAAFGVSALWVALTLAFEFLFFHYVSGHSWRELLAAYRFWEGRLRVVVLLATAAAPFVGVKCRA